MRKEAALAKRTKIFNCVLTVALAFVFGLAIFHWASYVNKWNAAHDEVPDPVEADDNTRR